MATGTTRIFLHVFMSRNCKCMYICMYFLYTNSKKLSLFSTINFLPDKKVLFWSRPPLITISTPKQKYHIT